MSQPGIGAMLHSLSSNRESIEIYKAAIGNRIKTMRLDESSLHFEMDDGYKFKLIDNGQSCCESRYMRSDDAASDFDGAVLREIEIADTTESVGRYGDPHEIQFLRIHTDKGIYTISSHVEHNGYYGGFGIELALD